MTITITTILILSNILTILILGILISWTYFYIKDTKAQASTTLEEATSILEEVRKTSTSASQLVNSTSTQLKQLQEKVNLLNLKANIK